MEQYAPWSNNNPCAVLRLSFGARRLPTLQAGTTQKSQSTCAVQPSTIGVSVFPKTNPLYHNPFVHQAFHLSSIILTCHYLYRSEVQAQRLGRHCGPRLPWWQVADRDAFNRGYWILKSLHLLIGVISALLLHVLPEVDACLKSRRTALVDACVRTTDTLIRIDSFRDC